jgi:hypothetical protein
LQTPEQKKEEFQRYLDKSGVVDALTKGLAFFSQSATSPLFISSFFVCFSWFGAVLVALYEVPEKPNNALESASLPSFFLSLCFPALVKPSHSFAHTSFPASSRKLLVLPHRIKSKN